MQNETDLSGSTASKTNRGLVDATTSGNKDHFKKATLGIIGLHPQDVAILNRKIVEYGNFLGLSDDQDFPETLAIGIPCNLDLLYLEDQANLCSDFGCDIIAITSVGKVTFNRLDKRITILSKEEGDYDSSKLTKKIFEEIQTLKNFRRPNIFFSSNPTLMDEVAPGEVEAVFDNLNSDQKLREKRITERKEHGYYPLLLRQKFVGVLGGAGPLASADFCQKLALSSTPFVHYSINSAPGKHYFEICQGPSFIPHYKNAVNFFTAIGATALAVPCNTAHKRIDEFRESLPVIDIRHSTLTRHKNAEGFILLGTNRTVGVDLPDGEIGIYEDLRSKEFTKDQSSFIIPTSKQQKVVMEAIYNVKAGRIDEAKRKILQIVEEIRTTCPSYPVILGCTELPLCFTEIEMAKTNLNFVDPAAALADATNKFLKEREQEIVLANSSTNQMPTFLPLGADVSSSSDEDKPKGSVRSASGSTIYAGKNVLWQDVDGMRIAVFKDTKSDSRITYRIAIEGSESSPALITVRQNFLKKCQEEIYGDLLPEQRSPEDRIRGGKYISFHCTSSPSPLEQKIKDWTKRKELQIQNGSSSQMLSSTTNR